MAKQQLNDTQQLNDEFTRIFDAYRAKIDEITRRTQKNLTPEETGTAEVAPPAPAPVPQVTNSILSRVSPRPVKKLDIIPVFQPPEDKPATPPTASPPVDKADIPPVAAPPLKKPDIIPVYSPPANEMEILTVSTPLADEPDLPASPPPSAETDTPPIAKLELPVVKESEVIIKEARRKAQRIIAETEEIIKKEAKKKTQGYVEKIIANAQKEAEEIVTKAAQSVERERAEAVAMLKQESERVIKEITEKYHRENRQQSTQIIAEAREKAVLMVNDIIRHSTEIGQQMDEIINRAKNTVAEFETKLRTETGELARAISETQNQLRQVTNVPAQESPKPATPSPSRNKDAGKNPTMSVHLVGDNAGEKHSGIGLFRGQVEMKSATSAFDYQYLKNLKKYLVHIPSIKYVQESASEREVSVLFDIKEPLPLVDILNRIPIIDEVITENDDDMSLIFKNAD